MSSARSSIAPGSRPRSRRPAPPGRRPGAGPAHRLLPVGAPGLQGGRGLGRHLGEHHGAGSDTVTVRRVTNYKAAASETRGATRAVKITANHISDVAGSQPTPQGSAKISGDRQWSGQLLREPRRPLPRRRVAAPLRPAALRLVLQGAASRSPSPRRRRSRPSDERRSPIAILAAALLARPARVRSSAASGGAADARPRADRSGRAAAARRRPRPGGHLQPGARERRTAWSTATAWCCSTRRGEPAQASDRVAFLQLTLAGAPRRRGPTGRRHARLARSAGERHAGAADSVAAARGTVWSGTLSPASAQLSPLKADRCGTLTDELGRPTPTALSRAAAGRRARGHAMDRHRPSTRWWSDAFSGHARPRSPSTSATDTRRRGRRQRRRSRWRASSKYSARASGSRRSRSWR